MFMFFQSFDDEDGYGTSYVGSFPQGFAYGADDNDGDLHGHLVTEKKPRILLMGLRR